MNNTIEFVLRMRDLMSSNLTRVGLTSQNTFTRMSQNAQGATTRNQVLGMSFIELQNKIKQVESTISRSTIPSQIAEARRELAALQSQAASHPGRPMGGSFSGGSSAGAGGIGVGGVAFGSMLGGFAQQGITKFVNLVADGVGAMITNTFAKEKAITGLTTFLGKEGAAEAYKNIRTDANTTSYDTASLLEVNRSLISAGLNAKAARVDTMNLANAVSAVGGGNDVLTRMAANMQQIKTVGKATAMDIRQFGIAGINIYEMLSRSTGKSIEQVKEMDVTYEQLSKTLAMAAAKGGIYEGALAAQGQTMDGKWNTFKDNVLSGLTDIGDAFAPVIQKFLDLGVKFANGIGPMLQTLKPYIDAISNGISSAVDYMSQLQSGTGGWSDYLATAEKHVMNVWNFVKRTGVQLWNLVSSIIEFVKNSEIIKDIFRLTVWYTEKVFRLIGWLFDKLIWLWENVIKPILKGIDAVYKWIKGGETSTVAIKATKTVVSAKKPETTSTIDKGAAMKASNDTAGKSAGETVAGAGPKTINIHVGKFFDSLQFTTLNTGESTSEIEKVVMECLARVVYNGAKMV